MRKISPPPPGFNPRNVQPISSPYNDCATPAHNHQLHKKLKLKFNRILNFSTYKNNRPVCHAVIQSGRRVLLCCLRILMYVEEAAPREQNASDIHCGCVHHHWCHISREPVYAHPPSPHHFHKTRYSPPFALKEGS
jgi:hypothetical protein